MYDPIGALAHLGVARAYVLSGDSVKAKSAYQDLLALWKDAEPDSPHPEKSQRGIREAAIAGKSPLVFCCLPMVYETRP